MATSTMQDRLWSGLTALMFLIFTFGTIVQYNDPDPLLWMTVYTAAAAATLLAFLRRDTWWFPALIAVLTICWAATIAPRVIGHVPFMDMFGAFEMKNAGIEESREMYGLSMIGLWSAALAVVARRRTATPGGAR